MTKEDVYDYDTQIEDVDEVIGTDIKINPDYYIHNAIVKAQAALINPDVKTGFLQFRLLVENVEILCKAARMIPADYDARIDEYKKTDEYAKEQAIDIRAVRLANKKLEILLTEVFTAKVSTAPMKI